MSLTIESQIIDSYYFNSHISQLYRQSLQPYVDPEMLELALHQPQPEQLRKMEPKAVGNKKGGCSKGVFMVLVAASCLLATGYHQLSSVAEWFSFSHVGNMTTNEMQSDSTGSQLWRK